CKMWTSRMVLDLVVFWRNQLDQSTPCVSTELNKKGIIWGFPSLGLYHAGSPVGLKFNGCGADR
ncbi:hypothetical protein ACRTDR_18525, partial [Shewanella algae]